jgi:hypothetical protein
VHTVPNFSDSTALYPLSEFLAFLEEKFGESEDQSVYDAIFEIETEETVKDDRPLSATIDSRAKHPISKTGNGEDGRR